MCRQPTHRSNHVSCRSPMKRRPCSVALFKYWSKCLRSDIFPAALLGLAVSLRISRVSTSPRCCLRDILSLVCFMHNKLQCVPYRGLQSSAYVEVLICSIGMGFVLCCYCWLATWWVHQDKMLVLHPKKSFSRLTVATPSWWIWI